jgi:hypothetical protein
VMEGVWPIVRALLVLQLSLCYGVAEGINIDLGSTRKDSRDDMGCVNGLDGD